MAERNNRAESEMSDVSLPDDIARFHFLGLLDALLFDRTTGNNIIWATDAFTHLGEGFSPKDAITKEVIAGENVQVIRRRSVKNDHEKNALTRAHAEVFTPSWIVKLMVDAADTEWREDELRQKRSAGWQKYVASPRLEITCGEAPFLVNRYDAVEGTVTPLADRTGILNRKLALLNENVRTRATWVKWATVALQSVYGYEFQGDNLLIARANVLCTMEDYLKAAGYKAFTQDEYTHFAEIISWNLWQMDGLTNCAPFGKAKKDAAQKSLFDIINEEDSAEEEQFGDCVIFDWKHERQVEFASIRKGSDMKFDYIIGNPPYQEEQEGDNENYAPSVYDKFMDAAYEVSDKVELITPARFLFNAGNTPKQWNKKMLDDPHLKVLLYEQDADKIFSGKYITGGIVITYHDRTRQFQPIGTFSAYKELNGILAKAAPTDGSKSIMSTIFNQLKFDLNELYKRHPNYRSVIGSKGKDKRFRNNAFEKLPDLFHEAKADSTDIAVLGVVNGKRVWQYISSVYLDEEDTTVEQYKAVVSAANGASGMLGSESARVITVPFVMSPGEGFTQTFIGIGSSSSKENAENCVKYIKSKFARVLLGALKVTQHNDRNVWKYVPLQDFTSNSDIDWSQSIANIDQQLYRKYGLSPEEIDFIETHVKAMD